MPAVIGDDFWEAAGAAYQNSVGAGFHRYHQRKREKVADQRYEQERADALRATEYQMSRQRRQDEATNRRLDLQEQRYAQIDERQAAIDSRFLRSEQNEASDVATYSRGLQMLAQPVAPDQDPERAFEARLSQVASGFKDPEFAARFTKEERERFQGRQKEAQRLEADTALKEMMANPAIAGDPVLAPRVQGAAETFALGGDHKSLLAALSGIRKEAGARQAQQQMVGEYRSKLDTLANSLRARIDAAEANGDYGEADELSSRLERALATAAQMEIEPAKAGQAYQQAIGHLQPGRARSRQADTKDKDAEREFKLQSTAIELAQKDERWLDPKTDRRALVSEYRGLYEAPAQQAPAPDLQAAIEAAGATEDQVRMVARMKANGDPPEKIKAALRGGK